MCCVTTYFWINTTGDIGLHYTLIYIIHRLHTTQTCAVSGVFTWIEWGEWLRREARDSSHVVVNTTHYSHDWVGVHSPQRPWRHHRAHRTWRHSSRHVFPEVSGEFPVEEWGGGDFGGGYEEVSEIEGERERGGGREGEWEREICSHMVKGRKRQCKQKRVIYSFRIPAS